MVPRPVFPLLLLFIWLTTALPGQSTGSPIRDRPNIVLIYADDLGRGLLGTYGQRIITTPNIDRLASGGMRFERAYGGTYCAPARMSLLTGRHDVANLPWQRITRGGIYTRLDNPLDQEEIEARIAATVAPAPADEVFLAEVARRAGYTTAQFGKLEWGFATTADRLRRHGWDHHFGYYDHVRCHGFYPPFLFENGEKVVIPGNTHADCAKTKEEISDEAYRDRWDMTGKAVYSEDIIMDRLLGFLDHHHPGDTGRPFFLYFPTQLPHGPVMIPAVHPDFEDHPELTQIEKEYASMVKMLDDDVGRILRKLEEMGELENTIIVFTSDNGHEIYYAQPGRTAKGNRTDLAGNRFDNLTTRYTTAGVGDVFDGNDGMAGHKRSNWEGGTRVPLFWYAPGRIAPGSVSHQMVSNYDFLNTLAEIVGQPTRPEKDGRSYAATLFGGSAHPRPYTFTSAPMGPAVVTQDGWKLRYVTAHDRFQLYYLPDDYAEERDLSAAHPDRVDSLATELLAACGGDLGNGRGPQELPGPDQR
ncbi:arylsulfatase A-like enzyme [Lewinella marina]|uniref:Sulfatase n=1 Tax=Neolewinella marina TaxID=438751 RepID=A0A2G0CFX7_9BACT|nr:sulfatase-like hydrolase/transferase [Neolewinella marina]NJB85425.1 arylsulfatase A-like enzyme [Neolewinella marina]PHK98883.1 sulfatase [Neolewinella marina]